MVQFTGVLLVAGLSLVVALLFGLVGLWAWATDRPYAKYVLGIALVFFVLALFIGAVFLRLFQ